MLWCSWTGYTQNLSLSFSDVVSGKWMYSAASIAADVEKASAKDDAQKTPQTIQFN